MQKKLITIIGLISAFTILGAGCQNSTERPVAPNNQQPADQTAAPAKVLFDANDTSVKEFVVTAKNWQFDPGTITVKKGDKVRLKITSTDIKHGFMLADYNINVQLEPSQTQVVEFVADKAGTFPFRCNIPCGPGHREMTGQLVVTE